MFSFFKRKANTESAPLVSSMGMWELSEDEQLLDQIVEYTYVKLEAMKVDLERRKFKSKDGKALSIRQVAHRLQKVKPHMPLQYIENSVLSWLEEAYMQEDITDDDEEEEVQMKIEAWLEAHEEARQNTETG